jgi:hypothetical protein
MKTITFVTRDDIYPDVNKDKPREDLELHDFLINIHTLGASNKIIFQEFISGKLLKKRLK